MNRSNIKFLDYILMAVLMAVMAGCSTPDTSEEAEVGDTAGSVVAFQFPERDMIPEGIAYDPVSETFFLGSIRKNKILRISMDGEESVFVPPGGGGIWGVLGMKVDVERRILWANANMGKVSENHDPDETQLTGIFKFNLEDGSLIKKYTIEKMEDNQLFNDVAVTKDGSVFITSFSLGTIFKIDSETDELTEFLPMPEGVWTNGIDITPDNRYLFIVGSEKIFRVNLETKELLELPVPEGETVGYGDGMYYYKNSLVVITGLYVENERHSRVVRLYLSEDLSSITGIEILDEDHPLYSSPTTGAIVDNWLYYIATAQFGKLDENGDPAPWDELSDTYILKVRIE